MTHRLGTLGLIAAMVLSLPTYAQDEEGVEEAPAANGVKAKLGRGLYLSPMFNYLRAAESRGTDDGMGGQLALGKSVTNGLNLELITQYLTADPKNGANGESATLTGVGLGAMVFPVNFLPDLYVPISIMRGQVKDNPGPIPDYSTTFFDIGLGYLIGLGSVGDYLKGTSIRAEVRYRTDAHGRERAGVHTGERKAFYEGVAAIGVLIPIGGAPPVAAEPAAEEAAPVEVVPVDATDTDGDGVTDDKDQCPDTPAGTTVDENGCPPAAPEPPPAPACTPPGPGEPIDLNGCKAGEAVVLRGVNFELDSARLTPNAKTILDGVADALLASQGIKVEVGGHTSSEASENYNQILSENRAGAVQNYLVGRGIDSGRMEVKGYGEGSPIADNNTSEGRELNRRVELKITDTGAPAAAPAAEAPPAEAAAPVEGEVAPAEAAPAAEGEAAPAADAAPVEGEAAPVEGEAPSAEAAPAEAPAEAAPAEAPPAEEPPPADAPAPEVQDAQPIQ